MAAAGKPPSVCAQPCNCQRSAAAAPAPAALACTAARPVPLRPGQHSLRVTARAAGRAGSGSRSASCLRATMAMGWRGAMGRPAAMPLPPTMETAATVARGVSGMLPLSVPGCQALSGLPGCCAGGSSARGAIALGTCAKALAAVSPRAPAFLSSASSMRGGCFLPGQPADDLLQPAWLLRTLPQATACTGASRQQTRRQMACAPRMHCLPSEATCQGWRALLCCVLASTRMGTKPAPKTPISCWGLAVGEGRALGTGP